MTKNEFLSQLNTALSNKKVADASEILSEYEQHFAFKLADGYSEEEIAAKLGNPNDLAAQFEETVTTQKCSNKKIFTILGLCFADLFAGILFVFLAAFGIVIATAAIAFVVTAGCLILKTNLYDLVPTMPYGSALIFGLDLLGLGVLFADSFVYFAAFLCQMIRSFTRFHHNSLAGINGSAILPSLPIHPQIKPKTNRLIRSIALVSLTAFAGLFVLGMIVSAFSAGAFGFWHVWGWFGYTGALSGGKQ